MKNYFVLMIVGLFVFTINISAQLDSVFYQGPSQGSVANGAMQNTDNFPDHPEIIQGEDTRVIPNVDRSFNSEPMIMDFENVQLPEYVYVEDPSVKKYTNLNKLGNSGSVLLNKFAGFGATNAIPPDPSMAVGPNHIVASVNGFPSFFRIFDKQGNILKTISVSSWFAPVSPDESGDGQVMYDHFEGRWILSFMQVNTGNQTAANLIAYSDDDDPIGTWYVYRFDTKKHGSIQTNTWGDYPQIGFDDEAIYISTRIFGFVSGFFGMKFRVIDKTELYNSNGGAVTWWDFWDVRRPNANPPAGQQLDGIHPTFSYSAADDGYFFYSNRNTANWYVLYKFYNPTADPPRLRGKDIPAQTYYTTPNANQLGGGTPLESRGSGCFTSPIVKDGKMYISHSVGNSNNINYASTRYVILDLNTQTIEEHSELGAIGYFYILPTITVDASNNIAISFTRSADTEYAGAFYSTKTAGDPPGLQPSVVVQEGLGNYQQVSSGRNRWGDYFAIYLDPSNNHDIFFHNEYANSGNSWATIIGHLIAAPYPGAHVYSVPGSYDFGDIETGTTSPIVSIVLANYGDIDLTITDIPSSSGDFNLETNLSFPIVLSTYDSITVEFSFTPSMEGLISEIYPVSSSDPQFVGIELSGTGYDVVLASEQTFYASSGSQNNGNMLTIDPLNGTGTNIGLSLYDELTSIAINPIDGKIYGIVAGSSSAEFVKVNAGDGDAHYMFDLFIPLMSSIEFDTTGTLYGVTRTGDIYTIDVDNATATFIVDAVGSYLGIAFHPQTNELWASSRAIAPPNNDAIFKVNLSTGDTTIIGHTGLGKQTNDIVFDENLNLYGVIGTPSQSSDFVSINTSTGAGTIIGSVGLNNVLSLAYIDELVLSVDDDENKNSIPSDYALTQNYPNPFNPSTTINFSLPVDSDVRLTIFNILGQEVINLINEQKSAGNHTVIWNSQDAGGSQLTSGIYLYKLTALGVNGKEFQDIKKMILLK